MELDGLRDRRLEMVQKYIETIGVSGASLLSALRRIPRHTFADHYFCYMAYTDRPLPLLHNQMMEPPSLIAYILEKARISASDRILEIGTGSGYQTALLSHLAKEVYSVEIVGDILNIAKGWLKRHNLENIFCSHHNGIKGWADHAPYDVILISSRLESIPKPLFNQLKNGGRLFAPLGTKMDQHLVRFTKKGSDLIRELLIPVNLFPILTEDVSERKGLYKFPAKEKAKLGVY
jgi:protein-L-isoaspartate(D-aspartate) O-methyltransferase